MDSHVLWSHRNNKWAQKSRIILQLLGFDSFNHFERVSGIYQDGFRSLFYSIRKCRRRTFAKAMEVIMSAYDAKKGEMLATERAFIKAWIKHWANFMIKERVLYERKEHKINKCWRYKRKQRVKEAKAIAHQYLKIENPVIKA